MRGVPKGNRPAILTYHDIGLNRESAKNMFADVLPYRRDETGLFFCFFFILYYGMCPSLFLPLSRQVLLQHPVQLWGHAGDHPALCRGPRGRARPAGRCTPLPQWVSVPILWHIGFIAGPDTAGSFANGNLFPVQSFVFQDWTPLNV